MTVELSRHDSYGPFFKDATEWIPVFEKHGRQTSSLDPRQLLFHYTNGGGLQGIAKSGEIWATHHEHTNDFTEVKYGLEIALREIRSRLPEPDGVEHHFEDVFLPDSPLDPSYLLLEVLQGLLQLLINRRERTFDFFIACFSEEGDLLSQWRAYATNAVGYSIGYLSCDLATTWQRSSTTLPIQLFSVIYEPDKQGEFIRAVLDKLTDIFRGQVEYIREATLRKGMDRRESLKRVITSFNAYALKWLSAAAIRVKHRGFREEQEWRLVFPINARNSEKLELPLLHRTVEGGLVPYVAMPLNSAIQTIWIGPKRSEFGSDAAEFAVRSFFEQNELPLPNLITSETPYR